MVMEIEGSPRTSDHTPPAIHTRPVVGNSWEREYGRRLLLTDTIVIVVAVIAAQLIAFGDDSDAAAVKVFGGIDYWLVSLVLVVGWVATVHVSGSRDSRVLGTGSREYQLVFNACFAWFGLVAIMATLFKVDIARGYLVVAFPLGLLGMLLGRKMWRTWLTSRREKTGEYSAQVMVIGSAPSVSNMVRELRKNADAGYHVIGVCIPEGSFLAADISLDGLHFGTIETAVEDLRRAGGNTIAVAGGDRLRTKAIRDISWKLATGDEHLILSPNLIDIAGPRIHTRPVSGLSLIHVETPRYAGTRRFLKETLDIFGALLFVVLSSPLLLASAIAIRLSSPGPVFFYQERIGLNGKPFKMFKFRSMVDNAETQLATLTVADRDAGNEVMFKLANDPRITTVGRWLRRFSIDELPQFFNVLKGDMSLVGPRPPLQHEVDLYAIDVHRRFLVRPGITGLWQVSGRSNLNWDDSVRLDLYYVENWSVLGDLRILWRTARAVLGRDGAY